MGIVDRSGALGPPLFISAGLLMFVQVLVIGLRKYGLAVVPEWWAAPPAIAAVIASILGLLTLYPRISGHAGRLAIASVCAGVVSGVLLLAAATWLLFAGITTGSVSPLPQVLQAAIALFMMTFVTAFLLSAAACLKTGTMRGIGLLLLVPVVSWCLILVIATLSTLESALKLDVYTNGVIAAALISVGLLMRNPAHFSLDKHWSKK